MSSFSFIHTADLHLDSPFSTLHRKHPALAGILRSASFEAFDRIIGLCIERGVDFLLVAGDIYDGEDRSLRAQIRFRDGLRKLDEAGIVSVVVHGNHDPLNSWAATLEWPQKAHIIRDRLQTVRVERDGLCLACVQGISYPRKEERRNLSRFFKRNGTAFHIGILHANVGVNTGHEAYAPCDLNDLTAAGMDYWALGHVHQRAVLSKEAPVILYPGNPQGRNIRETGPKGCYLVTVDENRAVDLEFCPTHRVRWVTRDVPISACRSDQDLIDLLKRTCHEISEKGEELPAMARIILSGIGPLYRHFRRQGFIPDLLEMLQEEGLSLSPFVWVEKIEVKARPPLDLEALENDPGFMGELLRCSRDLKDHPRLDAFVREELHALFGAATARRYLENPQGRRLKELLEAAEGLCAESLMQEDDA